MIYLAFKSAAPEIELPKGPGNRWCVWLDGKRAGNVADVFFRMLTWAEKPENNPTIAALNPENDGDTEQVKDLLRKIYSACLRNPNGTFGAC
jgi:hypothetical protein